MTSALNARIPTSLTVFDSSFNNIDSSGNWTLKLKTVSGDGSVDFTSPSVFSNTISTSITTAPTTTRQLGFRSQITSGWSNFTTGTSNVNTVTINGTTYAFGVYKLDLYLNYTSAGGGQFTIKACVSTTSATLATPVIFKDTNPPSDDGIFLSTTISAYTNTPFYIVVNGGGGTGTVKTTGTDTSAIILTRIG
jgi:hypothetical protein